MIMMVWFANVVPEFPSCRRRSSNSSTRRKLTFQNGCRTGFPRQTCATPCSCLGPSRQLRLREERPEQTGHSHSQVCTLSETLCAAVPFLNRHDVHAMTAVLGCGMLEIQCGGTAPSSKRVAAKIKVMDRTRSVHHGPNATFALPGNVILLIPQEGLQVLREARASLRWQF